MKLSTTELLNYNRCPRLLFLNKYGDSSLKLPPSDFLKRLWKVGKGYESKVTDFFTYERPKYKLGDYNKGAQETYTLMEKGVETIYQGVLKNDDLVGIPDFLIKAKGKSSFGDYYYYPVDIKSASTSRDKYLFQLATYAYMLGETQNFTPLYGGLLLLDLDLQIRYLYSFMKQVISAIQNSQDILSNPDKLPDLFIDSGCSMCQWYNFCSPEANKEQDLSLVSGISKKIKHGLKKIGINNYVALAQCSTNDIETIYGLEGDKGKNILLQAQALSNNQIYIKSIPNLSTSSHQEICIDFESDFLFDNNGTTLSRIDYLVGLLLTKNNKQEYKHLLLEDSEQEFIQKFVTFANEHADYTFYHYGHYEQSVIASKWTTLKIKLANLEKVIRESVIMPVTSYSLKSIAKVLGFRWKNKEASATQSMCWYSNYLATKDRSFLDLSIQYNKDDCLALHLVKNWLVNLQTQNLSEGKFIDTETTLLPNKPTPL